MRDSQGGRNREKCEIFFEHSIIFFNRKSSKRQEPQWKGRELGIQGAGSLHPLSTSCCVSGAVDISIYM